MSRRRRALASALVAFVLSGAVVGGVVAGGLDWAGNAERFEDALVAAQPTRVADIAAADGLPARGVYAQVTSTGHFCLSDAPTASPLMGGGGCNAADDPLGGRNLSVSLSYDGGPAVETVSDARLIGLASQLATNVRILMSDGTWRPVRLRQARVASDEFRAFGYRFRRSDLKKGVGPVAIVAFGASGAEIDRQTTGIG